MDGVLAVLPALSPSSHDAVRAPCPNGRTRFGVLVLSHERPKTLDGAAGVAANSFLPVAEHAS